MEESPVAAPPRGAGLAGREGTPLLVVVGVAGGGRGRACVRRMVGGPHLSHPKELSEFPPLCATGRRVLGATDLLPCVLLGHPTHLGLELQGHRGELGAWGQKTGHKMGGSQASHIPLLSLSFLTGKREMTVSASCGCWGINELMPVTRLG